MVTTEFAAGSSGAPILDRFGCVAGMVQETYSLAYNRVPLREEEGLLKVKQDGFDRNLFLSMNHQMTLRYAIPCESLRAFLKPPPTGALGPSRIVNAKHLGLDWQLFEGHWNSLPNFESIEPTDHGTCSSPRVDVHRGRVDNFALVFTGFIELPRDGVWQFGTKSDDGSRLFIAAERVVDNDGVHGAVSRNGARNLAAGLHAIRIEFFDQGGPHELKVRFSGPDQPWAEIPASVYRRE